MTLKTLNGPMKERQMNPSFRSMISTLVEPISSSCEFQLGKQHLYCAEHIASRKYFVAAADDTPNTAELRCKDVERFSAS